MLAQIAVDSVPRRLLPQSTTMQQTINLSPSEINGPREMQKNYVFVDEHNRHKRLKVMRACEGCRRRKIKCDAATTNTWPCSACTRLKLHCVPPMLQFDRDFSSNHLGTEHEQNLDFGLPSSPAEEEFMQQDLMRKASRTTLSTYPRNNPNYRTISPQSSQSHSPTTLSYTGLSSAESIEPVLPSVFQTQVYHSSPPAPVMRPHGQWQADNDYASALVGSLNIDDSGVARYISAQGRRLAETPAYEAWAIEEPNHPSFMPGQHEFAVRIPDEDMPSEEEASELFNIFFNHIHPYLPIVNKAAFFHLWETSRESISPLLLESIFACAGRLTVEPAKGLKWIAMATKHMDCFFDVPRLSTVQALLLLLKARESAPQRGYFFRSWMSVVHIVAMARDLQLDTHYDTHKQGIGCPERPLDCITRTRVWQACFAYELMICAPQGRGTMQCGPNSVDLSTPLSATPDLDEQEILIHRNFIHLVRLIHNIRRMSDVHEKLKANPNWRNDPQFLQSAPSLEQWLYDLPPDLRILVATDLSQPGPQLDSHYSGNLQVYYHLARIMVHRPALAFGKTFASGGEWRRHMSVCTDSAKSICRLEEVIFERYGMLGLQCMSRGVNFSIYALLSGALIHLVASTCPDPEFNHDAKEYFSRTMRLLENCIDNSASAEMKGQIETLREAFSVDVNRPFVLNPSFPFYHGVQTPIDPNLARAFEAQTEQIATTMAAAGPGTYQTHPLSPPHSTGDNDSKGDSPSAVQSLVMLSTGVQDSQAPSEPPLENIGWNPSRLFDNWNTAFGVSPVAAPISQGSTIHCGGHQDSGGLVDSLGHGGAHASSLSSSYAPPTIVGMTNSFVSPGMWQDSVAAATVFSESGKRTFPFGSAGDNIWGGTTTSSAPHRNNLRVAPPQGTALRASSRGH